MDIPWWLVLLLVMAAVIFLVVAVQKSIRAHHRRPATGAEGLVGESGVAATDMTPEGKVFVRGEYWDASGDELIKAGERIVVSAVEGMELKVRKAVKRET